MTAEVLPQPKALAGSVFADVASRTLTFRLAEPATGYERLLWQQGWQALRRAYAAGWPPGGPPWVFCDVPGGDRSVHGVPTDGGGLSFTFPVGSPGYAQLVGQPGLTGIATVDLSSHFISGVRFFHRSGVKR